MTTPSRPSAAVALSTTSLCLLQTALHRARSDPPRGMPTHDWHPSPPGSSRLLPSNELLHQMQYRSFSAAAAGGTARLADEAGAGGAHADPAGRAERCVDRR